MFRAGTPPAASQLRKAATALSNTGWALSPATRTASQPDGVERAAIASAASSRQSAANTARMRIGDIEGTGTPSERSITDLRRDLVVARHCVRGQDQRVERRRALAPRAHQQRIDIDAGELGPFRGGEHRQLRQGLRQRVEIAGRLAARPFQHRPAAQFANHAVRLLDAERRDAERDVAQDLDENATQPEHHNRAKDWIVLYAEYGLDPTAQHRRDQDAIDRGIRRAAPDALDHAVERDAGLARRNVEH